MENNKISAGEITAISSTFIALLALAISIWQGVETRQHNKISVIPKIDIFGVNTEIDEVEHEKYYGILFDNAGLGPALIEEYNIYIDGKKIVKGENIRTYYSDFLESESEIFNDSFQVWPIKMWWLDKEDSIIPERRRFIFAIPENAPIYNTYFLREFIYKKIAIEIVYKSYYGEVYKADYDGKELIDIEKLLSNFNYLYNRS